MALLATAVIVLCAVAVGGTWIGAQLLRQNGRMLLRLEDLETRFAATRSSEPHAVFEGNRQLGDSRIRRNGLAAGTRAPVFWLKRLGGGELSLDKFLGRRILLVFSDPGCGPCLHL